MESNICLTHVRHKDFSSVALSIRITTAQFHSFARTAEGRSNQAIEETTTTSVFACVID